MLANSAGFPQSTSAGFNSYAQNIPLSCYSLFHSANECGMLAGPMIEDPNFLAMSFR
jgi:hypothetical protein